MDTCWIKEHFTMLERESRMEMDYYEKFDN